MAATDERAIHEFPTGTIDDNSLLIMDRPTATPGEYETEKFAIANLGLKLLGGLDFPNDLDTAEQNIFGAINEVNAKAMNIADDYDDTATYAVGDLRIYNNTLYKCTTAITTAEVWNALHWTTTSIADEISALNTGKADVTNTYTKTEVNTALSAKFDKNKVHYGTGITFDSNGKCTINITSWGLSSKPDCVLATSNWASSTIVSYDRTNSTATSLIFICWDTNNKSVWTGTHPFSYVVFT